MRRPVLCENGRMHNDQTTNQNQTAAPAKEPLYYVDPEKLTLEQFQEQEEKLKAIRHLAEDHLPDPTDPDGAKHNWHRRRRGKIGLLPAALRLEVNQRLLHEQPAEQLLEWLNSLPEVKAAIAPFYGNATVTPQNLSNWRGEGYREWLI